MARIAQTLSIQGLARATFAGSAIALLTIALVYIAILIYTATLYAFPAAPVDEASLRAAGTTISAWGGPVFFLLLNGLAASIFARRAQEYPELQGVLIGAGATAAHQLIIFVLYPPVRPAEFALYLCLGLLGGMLGGRDARNALAERDALHRTTRRIAKARDAQEIVFAIGATLAHPDVPSLALWRPLDVSHPSPADPPNGGTSEAPFAGHPGAFEPLASWHRTPRPRASWPERLTLPGGSYPDGSPLGPGTSSLLAATDILKEPRDEGHGSSLGSALLVPLFTQDDKLVGLLSVAFDVRRRPSKGAIQAFATAGAQAALALSYLQRGVLIERQRLAREFHDTPTQGLTSIRNYLGAALEEKDPSRFAPGGPARECVRLAEVTARENLEQIRRLLRGLRPEVLAERPLSEALEHLVRTWSARANTEARLISTGSPTPLLPNAQSELYLVAQQALANVEKHARASRVTLTLSWMDDVVALDVHDDGVGFPRDGLTHAAGSASRPTSDVQGGMGLASMRERVEGMGGSLLVESVPDRGTILAVELPLSATALAPAGAPEPLPTRP